MVKENDRWARKYQGFQFYHPQYNCLLERAICRTFFTREEKESQCLCTHIHYPFVEGLETGVEILKLHGSINWIGILDGDKESSPIFIDARGIFTYKDIEVVPTCIGMTDDQDPSEVIIALTQEANLLRQIPNSFKKFKAEP